MCKAQLLYNCKGPGLEPTHSTAHSVQLGSDFAAFGGEAIDKTEQSYLGRGGGGVGSGGNYPAQCSTPVASRLTVEASHGVQQCHSCLQQLQSVGSLLAVSLSHEHHTPRDAQPAHSSGLDLELLVSSCDTAV